MKKLEILSAMSVMIVLALPSPASAQDFDTGLAAYNSADYVSAFHHWWPLSMRGHGKAQASLGFLYFKGLGVSHDDRAAAHWFARAADKNQPTAQFFLGTQYLFGRGVEKDSKRAYYWCDIALTNGFAAALYCRDEAANSLTTPEIAEASNLIADWYSQSRR